MKWGFLEEGLCFEKKIKTQVFDAKRGEFGAGRLGEIIGQVSEAPYTTNRSYAWAWASRC